MRPGMPMLWLVKHNIHHSRAHPVGHVWQAGVAIGAMSLVLVLGMDLAGALGRMDDLAAALVSHGDVGSFPLRLPDWGLWLATVLAAFGMAAVVLQTPGTARRFLLWLTAVLLVAAWAPVLGLAARHPAVAGPWVATVWSGVCAIFYASRHRMPCDEIPADKS
jgi:hypothetical protein